MGIACKVAHMDTQAVASRNSHMHHQPPWGAGKVLHTACITGMVDLGMVSSQAHTLIAHGLTVWGVRIAPG